MPKRYTGIDIGRMHVRAVQIVRTPEGLRLEKAFATRTRRSTDSLPRILRALMDEHGFDPRAEVAVSLPHQAFFFADIETDAGGLERLKAADPATFKDYFPIPADEIVVQICSVLPAGRGKTSVLVAATSREQIREQLSLLTQARIKPARVDAPSIAAHAAVVANCPQAAKELAVVLYVDESTLSITVMHDGNILLVRNIPMFSCDNQEIEPLARQTADIAIQEIEITWRRLFGKSPGAGLRLFLIAPRCMAELLVPAIGGKTDSQIVPVDPCLHVVKSQDMEVDSSLCIATGLALRTLQPRKADDPDFLGAYRARTRPRMRLERELAVCAALAVAAAVIWVAGLFLARSSLESHYVQLKREQEAIFRQAVPDEPVIVNPAAQLQQRLDALRKDCELFTGFNPGRPSPLQILATLSQQMPARGNLRLHDVLITADSIRVQGSCDSFAAFSEWQRILENAPGLRLVDVPQPKRDAGSDRVQFSILLSTAERKAL
jgi:Tfp pilus assembly protein PilN